MTEVIFVKVFIISLIWTCGWILRFTHTGAHPSYKNLLIVLGPWGLTILYFLLFWWG